MCPELCTRVNTPVEVAHIRQLCRVSSQNSMKRCPVMILQSSIKSLYTKCPRSHGTSTYVPCELVCAPVCSDKLWSSKVVCDVAVSICMYTAQACIYSSYQHNIH